MPKSPVANKTTLSQKLRNLVEEPSPAKSPPVQIKKEMNSDQISRLADKTNTLSKKLFKSSNKLGKSLNCNPKKQLIAHLNLKTK
jgi:hypothetical protein